MGGRTVPRRERKTSALQSHWSSPPDFPGMTFSLGNHFLRASTAIFIFNLFSKSCVPHDNAATAAFALKTASTARRACTYERPRAAARLHVRPRRLSKPPQRTCTLSRPSGFLPVVGARRPPIVPGESIAIVHVHALKGVRVRRSKEQVGQMEYVRGSLSRSRASMFPCARARASKNAFIRRAIVALYRTLATCFACAHDPCACR